MTTHMYRHFLQSCCNRGSPPNLWFPFDVGLSAGQSTNPGKWNSKLTNVGFWATVARGLLPRGPYYSLETSL